MGWQWVGLQRTHFCHHLHQLYCVSLAVLHRNCTLGGTSDLLEQQQASQLGRMC
jgi:hypothetical protein